MTNLNETAEQKRLNEARDQKVPWRKWGPLPVRAAVGNGTGGLQRQWRHPAQCQSTLQFGFNRRTHRIARRRPGNGSAGGVSASGPGLNPERFSVS
jgi:hypothetical protein